MVPFIGENGFYPEWCTGPGRWVQQRVFTTVRGMMAAMDELARPSVSHEALLWAPPRRGVAEPCCPCQAWCRSPEGAHGVAGPPIDMRKR